MAIIVPSGSRSSSSTPLLALHAYNPSPSGTETIYTTASTTLHVIDQTNMAISFTAPASGAVIVSVCAHWIPSQGGATQGGIIHGAMMESGSVVCGPNIICRDVTGNNFTDPVTLTVRWLATGLTPGSAHTYALAICADLTTGTTVGVAVGGTGLATNAGPALFEVWDAATA